MKSRTLQNTKQNLISVSLKDSLLRRTRSQVRISMLRYVQHSVIISWNRVISKLLTRIFLLRQILRTSSMIEQKFLIMYSKYSMVIQTITSKRVQISRSKILQFSLRLVHSMNTIQNAIILQRWIPRYAVRFHSDVTSVISYLAMTMNFIRIQNVLSDILQQIQDHHSIISLSSLRIQMVMIVMYHIM